MIDKLFKLTWKKGLGISGAIIFLIILHNLVSGLRGTNVCDAVTFILTIFGMPLYIGICAGYTIWKHYKGKRK